MHLNNLLDYNKYIIMGCGACAMGSAISLNESIYTQLQNQLRLYHSLPTVVTTPFITIQEVRHIESLMKQRLITQTLTHKMVVNTVASQTHLLNATRRIVWKLMLLHPFPFRKGIQNTFTENPPVPPQYEQQFHQIGLDIHRTYPTLTMDRAGLQLILRNVVMHFHNIGYTQGMNFYVAFLMICGYSLRETYMMFLLLCYNPHIALMKTFQNEFPQTKVLISVFEEQLERFFKDVSAKFKQYSINSYLYSFSWFMCFYLYNMTPQNSVLIWDHLLLGNTVQWMSRTIRIGLSIINRLKSSIIQSVSMDGIMKIFQDNTITQNDIQLIIAYSFQYPNITFCNKQFLNIRVDYNYFQEYIDKSTSKTKGKNASM